MHLYIVIITLHFTSIDSLFVPMTSTYKSPTLLAFVIDLHLLEPVAPVAASTTAVFMMRDN